MRKLFLIAVLVLCPTLTLACAPAPSCWLTEGPAYLKSVCVGYKGKTLSQIKEYVDEPEQVPAFARACKKFGVNFK